MINSRLSQTFCIIGAGPAGLTCALTLSQKGFLPIIFDRSARNKTRSRATGLQKDTLEVLDILGVGDQIRAASTPVFGTIQYDGYAEVRRIMFASPDDQQCNNLSVNQAVTEKILLSALESKTSVQWEHDIKFLDGKIKLINGKTFDADYLIGADGRNSIVREAAGIVCKESLDNEISFGCDATLSDQERLDHDYMHQMQFEKGRLVFVPLLGKGNFKISGTFSSSVSHYPVPTSEELLTLIYERSGILVQNLEDIFLYRLGTQRARDFGNENIILIGDAAQTFFPNGGFGLNTAIQQGYSLGSILSCEKDPLITFRNIWTKEITRRFDIMQSLRCK